MHAHASNVAANMFYGNRLKSRRQNLRIYFAEFCRTGNRPGLLGSCHRSTRSRHSTATPYSPSARRGSALALL